MNSKLKTLVELVLARWREPIVCEGCGKEFQCGAKLSGCWCSDIPLGEEARTDLRTRFTGCLCPRCLLAFSEKRTANTNYQSSSNPE